MDLKSLITLIQEYGLSAYQTDLLENVRPAIALHLEPLQERQPGQSRIGGLPDLPDSVSWPQDRYSGDYLDFLLQINLAELPIFPDNPLPQQGMLYLFNTDSLAELPDPFVVYGGDEPLVPASLPEGAEFAVDWYRDVIEHRLTFSLFADLPRWATSDHEAICDRLELDEDSYNDLTRALDGRSMGKLLGHVAGIGHDPRERAYLTCEVEPDQLSNLPTDEQRHQLAIGGARQWCNLLQVDSTKAINLLFGDSGYLQLLVHEADLHRQNLSRIYMNLESS